jgi:hypothetical protein
VATDLFIFVMILAVVVVGGILLGMIVATRIDRITNPVQKPCDPGPEPRATEEQQP